MSAMNEYGLPADIEWLYAPNIPYAQRNTGELCLQIIFPYRRNWQDHENYPVLLFVPGAAWYRQEMYNSVPQWAKLAERGIVVAAVQVRSSAEAKFPAQVDDLLDAMHHIAGDAERWHINPHRMFLAGQSSGAHISLLTALAHQKEITAAADFTLRGVIGVSAPTEMTLCGGKPSCDLLGVSDLSAVPERAAEASCGMYISPDAAIPPLMLIHGTSDSVVSVEHSRRLYIQLAENRKRARLLEVPGEGHGGAWQWRKSLMDEMMHFIRECDM